MSRYARLEEVEQRCQTENVQHEVAVSWPLLIVKIGRNGRYSRIEDGVEVDASKDEAADLLNAIPESSWRKQIEEMDRLRRSRFKD